MANSLEAFAGLGKETGYSWELLRGNPPASTEVLLGLHVATNLRDSDEVARRIIARATELEATQPAIAERMVQAVQWWSTPAVNAWRMRRIENGTADAATIAAALTRRGEPQDRAALRRMDAAGGIRSGIAAVLRGDLKSVLADTDREAQRALLAASRLIHEPIPLKTVESLFGHTPALDAAAEAWLLADDSTAARAMVQRRHADGIRIFGQRPDAHPLFDEWEQELLQRFRASKADEVIALGRKPDLISEVSTVAEITIRGGKVTLRSNGRKVALDPAALADLRQFLADSRFDELSHFDVGTHDGTDYEYVHLTRDGGRRVFMNTPYSPETDQPYAELVRKMEALVR